MHVTIHTSDGQPATGSPNTNARTISAMIAIKETTVSTSPRYEEIFSGTSEKLIIPSNE